MSRWGATGSRLSRWGFSRWPRGRPPFSCCRCDPWVPEANHPSFVHFRKRLGLGQELQLVQNRPEERLPVYFLG